jgi:hypothetical protein
MESNSWMARRGEEGMKEDRRRRRVESEIF